MSNYKVPRRSALLGMALALALPTLGAAQDAPKTGGTLKISHSTRIATLNVLSLSGPAEYPVIDMAYSGLTRIGLNNQPMPDLAESWEASEDATEFTFKLREGVTFHDGTPATASDVVATYEAILNPDIPASARSVLDMVDRIEAVDDLTVKFHLKTPYADFPTSTAHANARILSEEALAGDLAKLDTVVNGTGPFKMESYDSARITRLVRNDDYFIEGLPHLDAVEMHLFPDLAAETTNFLSGDIDVMLLVQQADYERIASSPDVNAQRVSSGRYVNVVMRFDQPPFDDLRVREALSYAIDRQLLVDLVLEGLGRPAHDNILSPEFKFRIDTPEKAYDPEKAKALLAEAGYPDGLSIDLVASNRPAIRAQVAIAIKQMALPAGFDINVETMPHDTYLANVWRKGNFYMAYWGMQPTEDATFNLLLTSDASYEDTGWKNAEFDAMVQKGRSTTVELERASAYARAQELMFEELPYIIAFYEDALTASKERVKNYTINPINRYFYLENVWLTSDSVTFGYLVRRLLAVILVLFVVTFAVFAITMILPGNAAIMILGEYGTEEAVAALERRLGLNQPWFMQYADWLGGVLHWDFGQSLRLSLPVTDVVGDAFWNSAALAVTALISVVVIAIPLGVLAAVKRGTRLDFVISLFSYVGASMPEFVTATLLLLFLAGPALGLLPAGGFVAPGESIQGFFSHVILPAGTLGLILTAHISRQVRSEMSEVLASDYIRAARLKGLRERRVIRRHALPNSLAPAVAVISLDIGYLLGGIIVVEEIFAWPGLGRLLIYALENRDLPVIQAITLLLAMVYALSNLLSDIVIALLDPRVRYA